MKKQDQIAALLEKYWEGETSLEEERILKAYFQNGPVDPRFEAEAALFRALKEEQLVEWNRHAEIKPVRSFRLYWAAAAITLLLSAGIWWMQQKPAPTDQPVIAQKKTNNSATQHPHSRTAEQPKPPTAEQPNHPTTLQASIKKRKKPSVPAQPTPEDAEAQAAMEEIKAALALVSRKLKKGRTEINKGLQEVEHMEIFKTKNSDG